VHEHEWVYKTPAIVESLFLHPITWRSIRPTVRWKQFVFAHFLESLAPHAPRLDRFAVTRERRRRMLQFQEMCRLLSALDGAGVGVYLLPCEVIRATCTLRDEEGAEHEYSGMLLKQRRADHFFEYFTGVERFAWEQLVLAQQALWRCGVGFADADEVLGPRNWALHDGQVRLADTGSLTRDFRRVRHTVSDSVLDACQQRIPLWWPDRTDPQLAEYLAFVRHEINLERLRQLWRADC
jgi:hypothetical protein